MSWGRGVSGGRRRQRDQPHRIAHQPRAPYVGKRDLDKNGLYAFLGTIDEPIIFDRALTMTELESVFAGKAPLMVWWVNGHLMNRKVVPLLTPRVTATTERSTGALRMASKGTPTTLLAKNLRQVMSATLSPLTTTNNPDGGPVTVGSYPHAPGPYGTFDQQAMPASSLNIEPMEQGEACLHEGYSLFQRRPHDVAILRIQ